jgi:predicted nucleic acid-binding protein
MNKIVVSNTTPIISLCSVKLEFVLKELFGTIFIPQAVDMELNTTGKPGEQFSSYDWVKVQKVKNKEIVQYLSKDLDKGESETIPLATQMRADVVIIDESAGYQIAKLFDLPVVRTLSLLKVAKEKNIIKKIYPILDEMVKNGRWYSDSVVKKFLNDVGE